MAEADELCDRIAIVDQGRVVAEGNLQALTAMVERDYGRPPTLESVFMTYTGRSLDEDVEENGPDEEDDKEARP